MRDYGTSRLAAGSALAFLLGGCATPVINALDPNSGPPQTVVTVDGEHQLFSTVEWDGTLIPGAWYGGVVFSVPHGATVGGHNVTLSNSHGTSAPAAFTVTAPVSYPDPEIKGVQIYSTTFSGATVDTGFMVYGSNIDVGATIRVNGMAQTTGTHQVLVNDFFGGVDPESMGDPAYHYTSLIASTTGLTAGATVTLEVVNLDGTVSPSVTYELPASTADLDSDGDGLLDDWEENGYDADGDGVVDVDLPAMGADKHHMDLFVEVDIMNGLSNPPTATTWTIAETAFANAPVLNLDGEQGIALHIDRGQGAPFTEGGTTLTFKNDISYTSATSASVANVYDVKSADFDSDRLNVFRYAIWASALEGSGASGRAEGIPANDFVITMDTFPAGFQTDQSRAETFVHELGHTLGFGHGGPATDARVDEPNHLSIMAYCWQFLSVQADCITCNAAYTNTAPNYSEGMAANLVETNLDENEGVCDHIAVNWNGNGVISAGVSANINPDDGPAANETLDDHDEWHSITYDFTEAGSQWGGD